MLRSLAPLLVLLVACNQGEPPAKSAAPATPATPDTPATPTPAATPAAPLAAAPQLDHVVEKLEGGDQKLSDLRGKAVLVVNTASQCGFTPQYAKLQELYGRYKDRGLVVIGFPSNDFGEQEPGSPTEIKEFVQSKFAVDFPMMNKVHAKGPEIAPIYKTLTEETPEGIRGEVKWNFTKFLVDTEGRPIARFEPKVDPLSPEVIEAIEKALPKSG